MSKTRQAVMIGPADVERIRRLKPEFDELFRETPSGRHRHTDGDVVRVALELAEELTAHEYENVLTGITNRWLALLGVEVGRQINKRFRNPKTVRKIVAMLGEASVEATEQMRANLADKAESGDGRAEAMLAPFRVSREPLRIDAEG